MNYATLHTTEPTKSHWGDKILRCCKCQKWILIPHNVVGGAWHLNSFEAADGSKHHGTHCNPCFDALQGRSKS